MEGRGELVNYSSSQGHNPLTTAGTEDRSSVLRQLIQSSVDTLVGFQKLNEQQFHQTLGALVRTKALNADDSYTLRDQLQKTDYFENALDSRIEVILKKRGLIDDAVIQDIRSRDLVV